MHDECNLTNGKRFFRFYISGLPANCTPMLVQEVSNLTNGMKLTRSRRTARPKPFCQAVNSRAN